jgi:pimeloyl-ACP methyl ester carboxylesterase
VPLERVTSADGTPIAVERAGEGPPLVLVHGATVDRSSWRGLVPLLTERFACWLVDRRGRGESSDTAPYDPEREVEDLLAVFDRVGQPLDLFGHSSGAVLALEAARRSTPVRHLALYEPPMRLDPAPPGGAGSFLERIEAHLAAGDRAEAVRAFYRGGPGISDEQLARMEAGRSWPTTVAIAHTMPYDVRLVGRYGVVADHLRDLTLPTLLLVGEASPPRDHRLADALISILPAARVVRLPGQGHRAMATAPDLLAQELSAFL